MNLEEALRLTLDYIDDAIADVHAPPLLSTKLEKVVYPALQVGRLEAARRELKRLQRMLKDPYRQWVTTILEALL